MIVFTNYTTGYVIEVKWEGLKQALETIEREWDDTDHIVTSKGFHLYDSSIIPLDLIIKVNKQLLRYSKLRNHYTIRELQYEFMEWLRNIGLFDSRQRSEIYMNTNLDLIKNID